MTDGDVQKWQRRLERERHARQAAEHLLEVKSLELFHTNQQLVELTLSLEQDIQARTAELVQALQERELLLKEIHHRVKNNLQVVASMLSMQADNHPEGDNQVLLDSIHRVRAMALIHEQLYSGADLGKIDLGGYADALAQILLSAFDPAAFLTVDVQPVMVPIGMALPCGLILNEVVSNAFKHGRSTDGTCHVTITVGPSTHGFCIGVQDQGPGLQHPWHTLKTRTLGTRIVTALARQLRPDIDTHSESGFCFRLQCPFDDVEEPRFDPPR